MENRNYNSGKTGGNQERGRLLEHYSNSERRSRSTTPDFIRNNAELYEQKKKFDAEIKRRENEEISKKATEWENKREAFRHINEEDIDKAISSLNKLAQKEKEKQSTNNNLSNNLYEAK